MYKYCQCKKLCACCVIHLKNISRISAHQGFTKCYGMTAYRTGPKYRVGKAMEDLESTQTIYTLCLLHQSMKQSKAIEVNIELPYDSYVRDLRYVSLLIDDSSPVKVH